MTFCIKTKFVSFFTRKMRSTSDWFPRAACATSTPLCLARALPSSACLTATTCPPLSTGGKRAMSLMSRIRSSAAPAGPSVRYVKEIQQCPFFCKCRKLYTGFDINPCVSFRLGRWRDSTSGRLGSWCLWASSSWSTAPPTTATWAATEAWWTTPSSTSKPTEA